MALAIASAVTGGVSAIGGLISGSKARRAAKKAAGAAWRETQEEHRRLEKEQTYTESLSRARMAASGVMTGAAATISGSMDTTTAVMKDMYAEHKRQRDWLLEAGRARAKAIKRGGDVAWYQSVTGAISDAVSAWGNFQAYRGQGFFGTTGESKTLKTDYSRKNDYTGYRGDINIGNEMTS